MTTKTLLLAGAAALALAAAAPAQAQEAKITWKGPAPELSYGDFSFRISGRAFLDAVVMDVEGRQDPVTNPSGIADLESRNTRVRTARLAVEGDFAKDWSYKAEVAVAGGEADWEDLYIRYSPTDAAEITVGHIKTLSLENLTSSRFITFMERGPFNDVLDLGRTVAAQVKVGGDNWTLAGAVTGDNINNPDLSGLERIGVLARATFAPVDTDRVKLHLGAWARVRDAGDEAVIGTPFVYRARNNTNVGDRYTSSSSGGAFGFVADEDVAVGAEAALVYGPVSVQGEYAHVEADRFCAATAGVDPCGLGTDEGSARTFYVFASWFPTGEMRRYDAGSGRFNRIKVKRPVTGGGPGAVELAVRYDRADLTDMQTARRFTSPAGATQDVVTGLDRGGVYEGVTFGATWYPFSHVRFMANYTDARNDNPRWASPFTGGLSPDRDADVKVLQFRAQFDF